MIARPELTVPQGEFFQHPAKYKAFVAGFGSGKTWVGGAELAQHCYDFPRVTGGYFAPTYPQIRDIFYPTVEEVFETWGMRVKIKPANHEVEVYQAGRFLNQIICRSMEDPASIVGFKIGKAVVDELDVMAKEKAAHAWRKILARLRYNIPGLQNGVVVTTTPEGFKFTYDQFVSQVQRNPELGKLYGIVHASTYDNEANLPEDYIPSLLASYPPQLIDAYIRGQFVNLQTGNVYAAYNRVLNRCRDTVQAGEPIFVGMDFNVGKMAAIVHVKRDGLPRAVDEIVNAYDTPDMVRKLQDRFWNGCARTITVYPDASGGSRKTVNASETDIALLRAGGLQVRAPNANPPVKDRINAMNGMFCNAEGLRRYLVNDDLCSTYVEALEQQAWGSNGEPDKTTGHDHPVDGAGYFISYEYPIISRRAKVLELGI